MGFVEAVFGFFAAFLFFAAATTDRQSQAFSGPPALANLGLGGSKFWRWAIVAGMAGLALSGADLLLDLDRWILVPLAFCIGISASAVVQTALEAAKPGKVASPMPGNPTRLTRRFIALLLVVVFAGAFYLGTVLHSGGSKPIRAWSPYHVEGTETNGSGFVNKCSEPSPCAGKAPVGRLREGDLVFIECQLKGERAESSAGDESYVWDRLITGEFVSDLFVSTPGEGHFSPGLNRCTPWHGTKR